MKATGYLIDEVEGLTSIHDSAKVFGSNAMKRFDFGLGLKAGVEFFQKYQVSIGYDWGLLDNIEDSGNKKPQLDALRGVFLLRFNSSGKGQRKPSPTLLLPIYKKQTCYNIE